MRQRLRSPFRGGVTEATDYSLQEVVVVGERAVLPGEYPGGQVAKGSQAGVLGYKDFKDLPFSVNSYTSTNMENKMAYTVADVAKDDPAVRFQYPSYVLSDNMRIRNFTYNVANMTLNGMMGMAPYGTVPTEFLERVEIQRGPTAFINGINPGGEIAGNINLVTKHAGEDPLTRLSLNYTSDSQMGAHVDVGQRFGQKEEFGVRLNAAYRSGDTTFDDQSQKRTVAAIGMDYKGDKLKATLDGYYTKEKYDGAAPFLVQSYNEDMVKNKIIPSVPSSSSSVKGLYGEAESKGIIFHADYNFNDNLSAYMGVGKTLNYVKGYMGGGTFRDPDAQGNGRLEADVYNLWLDKVTYEAGLRSRFEMGAVSHEVVFGGSILNLKQGNATASLIVNDNMYNLSFDGTGLPAVPANSPKIQEYKMSSFALADTMSFDKGKYQFIVGARHQKVDQTQFGATGAVSRKYNKSKTTPVFAFIAKPWGDQVSLYASYIEGLRPGSIVPDRPIYTNRNHVFAPYSNKQIEFGAKFDTGKWANTLAFYQIKQPSMITIDNGDGTYTAAMDGEQRNRGIEWMTFGELNDTTRILGGISYGQAEIVKANNGLNEGKAAFGSPRWQANLGVEWDTSWNRNLTLTARMIFTGSQYIDSANTMELPSSTTFDIGARYKTEIGKTPVTFRMAVENLFDKEYWAGLRADKVLFVGTGRTFKFSMDMEF